MERRRVLSVLPLVAGISGCIGSDPNGDETTPNDGHNMGAGSAIVDVAVQSDGHKEVVLEADCRDADFTLEPGSEFRLTREKDGESCSVRLFVDGDEAYTADIIGAERHHLTVTKDGTVESKMASV